ncbi:hypothetical protein CesoFtcFv8_027589 [Champsocephalus esox]|uniref:Uncharacterized protein n=2 Tax=Champsocephalus TaxID=52236 RepID=A0AAN8GTC1_CHAGU|nr:hypothetical protein CesoFtcFv8_027589 [Champsocephalus esox]KAK5891289.1 hypothetical protein CgunFtcFv8_018560 [Champsocephalus gunnari]
MELPGTQATPRPRRPPACCTSVLSGVKERTCIPSSAPHPPHHQGEMKVAYERRGDGARTPHRLCSVVIVS